MWMHEALRGVWWHENIQKGVPWEDMGIIRLSHCFLPVLLFTVWFRCWTMLHVVDRQDRIFNRKWMKMVFAVCNRPKKRFNINMKHHQPTSLQQCPRFPVPLAEESNPFYNSFKRSKQRCVPRIGGHWPWWKTHHFWWRNTSFKTEWSWSHRFLQKRLWLSI